MQRKSKAVFQRKGCVRAENLKGSAKRIQEAMLDSRQNDTVEELKAMLSRKPQVDMVTHTEGNFGYEKTNPIPVCDQPGELKYLATLRCACDEPFFFQRLGNCGTGPDKHIVDAFELVCRTRMHRITLYFDMYHVGHSACIPDGFSQGKRGGIGLPHRVPDFPDGFSEFSNIWKSVESSGVH